MKITAGQIRGHRLRAHHLDRKYPMDSILAAAGACGLQNSPPGAWETALFNRLDGCTLQALDDAINREKTLLQAWSYRGVPVVFPTGQSAVFLTPLIAREGERPWIYTQGITGALDYLQMTFDEVLVLLKKAIGYLDTHTVKSKEALDQTLADLIHSGLPEAKQVLWNAPSMYGNPEKQTVGAAAVSFLLRPCSFSSLVVFGERKGISPTFTSYRNWTGQLPAGNPDGGRELVRKFLHCYGPSTVDNLMSWLGCCPRQARRLWAAAGEEMLPVQAEGKECFLLETDGQSLLSAGYDEERLLLLGAHDPYLDLRDRTIILEDQARHKTVWKYVANPGAVLKGGRIIGIWKTKTQKDRLDLSMALWEPTTPTEGTLLEGLAEEYAVFRDLRLRSCAIESLS